jgi:hypothetical protein
LATEAPQLVPHLPGAWLKDNSQVLNNPSSFLSRKGKKSKLRKKKEGRKTDTWRGRDSKSTNISEITAHGD